jgi:hypothetical protein
MRFLALALLATLNIVTLSAAQHTETRQHYIVFGNSAKFTATRIDSTTDTVSKYTTLLKDEGTGRLYRLEGIRNYAAGTGEYRLTDVASREWVAVKYAIPTAGKDRRSAQAEIAKGAAEGKAIKVTMFTRTAAEELDENAWRIRATSAEHRNRIRGSLSAGMIAAATSIQSLASVPLLEDYCIELLAPLTARNCPRSADIKFAFIPPNCGFDAMFGETCTEKQQKNAVAAIKGNAAKYY